MGRARRLAATALLAALGASARSAPCAASDSFAETSFSRGLRARGERDFIRSTRSALARIRKTRCGSAMLKALEASGSRTTIRMASQSLVGATMEPLGEGDSLILWDPAFTLPDFPPFLVLYHELVHALHEASGQALPRLPEERRTVGLSPYEDYELSENAMRKELGLPPRNSNGWEEFPGQAPLGAASSKEEPAAADHEGGSTKAAPPARR